MRDSVQNVLFRNKISGWKQYSIVMKFNNERKYQSKYMDDIFMRGFLSNIFLRPSCYHCKFKSRNYWSDITLGDFWGIDKFFPDIDDDKGVSVVIINSKKGVYIFDKIREKLDFQAVDYNQAVAENKSLAESSEYPPERSCFFAMANKIGIESSIEYYTSRSFIGRLLRKFRRLEFRVKNRCKMQK